MVALSWVRMPLLPDGLPWIVRLGYTPSVVYPVIALLTVGATWQARRNRERLWRVLGGSALASLGYLLLLPRI